MNGITVRLKELRENQPEICERHKLVLAFVEDYEEIHIEDLIKVVGHRAAMSLARDVVNAAAEQLMVEID